MALKIFRWTKTTSPPSSSMFRRSCRADRPTDRQSNSSVSRGTVLVVIFFPHQNQCATSILSSIFICARCTNEMLDLSCELNSQKPPFPFFVIQHNFFSACWILYVCVNTQSLFFSILQMPNAAYTQFCESRHWIVFGFRCGCYKWNLYIWSWLYRNEWNILCCVCVRLYAMYIVDVLLYLIKSSNGN